LLSHGGPWNTRKLALDGVAAVESRVSHVKTGRLHNKAKGKRSKEGQYSSLMRDLSSAGRHGREGTCQKGRGGLKNSDCETMGKKKKSHHCRAWGGTAPYVKKKPSIIQTLGEGGKARRELDGEVRGDNQKIRNLSGRVKKCGVGDEERAGSIG